MYAWLCSACFHGTTMRNTTGERVHIAACAARQKNRPSFGHFSTCESSMEASLGVSEAPKSVAGTWYAPFSAVLRSQNQNTPPNDKICYTVRERTELQLVKRHACVQGPHPSRVPACSVGARSAKFDMLPALGCRAADGGHAAAGVRPAAASARRGPRRRWRRRRRGADLSSRTE